MAPVQNSRSKNAFRKHMETYGPSRTTPPHLVRAASSINAGDNERNGSPQPPLSPRHQYFKSLPPVFVVPANFDDEELMEVEEKLMGVGARVTYDPGEARVFVGRIERKRRAVLELRERGVWTEEMQVNSEEAKATEGVQAAVKGSASGIEDFMEIASTRDVGENSEPTAKRRKIARSVTRNGNDSGVNGNETDDSKTESEDEDDSSARTIQGQPCESTPGTSKADPSPLDVGKDEHMVIVLHSSWVDQLSDLDKAQKLNKYTVYVGRVVERPDLSKVLVSPSKDTPPAGEPTSNPKASPTKGSDILDRALEDSALITQHPPPRQYQTHRRGNPSLDHKRPAPPKLHHHQQSTSSSPNPSRLPSPPPWLTTTRGGKYSCQRRTPHNPPNAPFLSTLKTIRDFRRLTADEIGVRAYSTAIASIAAYPHTITSTQEITRLPGCSERIAGLWREWKDNDGVTEAVRDGEGEERMQVLRLFDGIWGVGAHTARVFCDVKGWRDLDDVVEHGWQGLSREQQLGVKYYHEFAMTMERAEVEGIERVVRAHFRGLCKDDPDGVRTCIVGGYRRGKKLCHDADIMVSHTDEAGTHDIVDELVGSLHQAGYVTHSLRSENTGSKRGQSALPYRDPRVKHSRRGFDSLDKSMVVWQDPHFSDPQEFSNRDQEDVGNNSSEQRHPSQQTSQQSDIQRRKDAKNNPNPHRRVDIIVTPWSNIGCAVLGWTAATTFERDLRRYSKEVKGWKFDSSGIRDLRDGRVVDCSVDFSDDGSGEEQLGDDLGRGRAMVSSGNGAGMEAAERSAQTDDDTQETETLSEPSQANHHIDPSDPGFKDPKEEQQIERAERKVFEVLDLDWIHPWDRCTG
ncbi:MAG: hypothetical protein M1831_005096 [Alyxoria varia]|nr:MAG: hypothetical protein M1831_005096 [Alyxoria varia]